MHTWVRVHSLHVHLPIYSACMYVYLIFVSMCAYVHAFTYRPTQNIHIQFIHIAEIDKIECKDVLVAAASTGWWRGHWCIDLYDILSIIVTVDDALHDNNCSFAMAAPQGIGLLRYTWIYVKLMMYIVPYAHLSWKDDPTHDIGLRDVILCWDWILVAGLERSYSGHRRREVLVHVSSCVEGVWYWVAFQL